MLELSFAGGQAADDLSKRPRSPEVAKQERNELAPTGHSLGVLLALMLADCTLKNSSRNESQNLTENAAYSWHGRVILSCWWLALPTLPGSLALLPTLPAIPPPQSASIVLDSSAAEYYGNNIIRIKPLIL